MLWAVSGLILTVISTFLQPYIFTPVSWSEVSLKSIDASFQVGAVLFTACVGGRNAAIVSQTAYVCLGLVGMRVFYQGGGLGYINSPAFGYLLGFIVGGAVCGHLAFRLPRSMENLALSCLLGLGLIHAIGIGLIIVRGLPDFQQIISHIQQYSVYPFGGQVLIVCASALLAGVTRFILLY
jgi:biotin transport system substrate-specific component